MSSSNAIVASRALERSYTDNDADESPLDAVGVNKKKFEVDLLQILLKCLLHLPKIQMKMPLPVFPFSSFISLRPCASQKLGKKTGIDLLPLGHLFKCILS